MIYLGIDPGASGGIAALQVGDEPAMAWPMPETEREIFDRLRMIQTGGLVGWPEADVKCYMEAVHSFPGQGVASSFTFGKGYGFLRGVLVALHIPLIDVSPMKWKKALGITFTAQDSKKDKKNGSKALAQQWFPHLKITHAISEALLIAEYGRRQP